MMACFDESVKFGGDAENRTRVQMKSNIGSTLYREL